MKEIEVKVLGIDIEKVKKDIIKLGGILIKKEYQENYYYKLPDNTDYIKGYIRIRKINDMLNNTCKTLLCVKKLLSQGKYRTCEEHEFEVSDFKECSLFLDSIKISYIKKENKFRESYTLDNVLVEFDVYDKDVFPYPYIEVEAENEKDILNLLDKLKIDRNLATSKTLEEIKKEMGID